MKKHTIILIPHARAKFRKWRFSTLQAGIALGSLAALTLGGLVTGLAYFSVSFDRDELSRIADENASLRDVNQGFEKSVRELESQLADYQDRIHKLAIVAGLPELSPSAEAGIGGSESLDVPGGDVGSELRALSLRLDGLGEGTDLLQRKLDERRVQISATPAIAPVRGILTSGFGVRRDPFTGRPSFHSGIDFVAPPGKEVAVTGDGIVTHAGRDNGLGKAVYVSHGFGVSTRYGHLSKTLVEVGQRVRRGDTVGLVGNTGRSTGYHLHYEVWVDGEATNPLGYILDEGF